MTTKDQIVRIPYVPRKQQAAMHKELDAHRFSVVVIHRRWGKTVMLLNQLIKRAMTCPLPDGRYVYIAPFLKQAKTLAWDYLKRFTDPIPGRTYSESETRVNLPNGSQIRLFGADNPNAIRGIYCDGAVLDEYAQCNSTIFSSILRPAVSDRGGWVIFSGTPNGRNDFFKKLQYAQASPSWYWAILKGSETGIIPQDELADARSIMTEEEYAREYECSFDSIIGKRIYPEFSHRVHVADPEVSLRPTQPTKIIRGWDNTGLSPAVVFTHLTPTGQWQLFKEMCFFDVGIQEATEAVILWSNLNLPPECTFVDYADPDGQNRDSIKMTARAYTILKAREMGQEIWPIDGVQTWKVRRESVAGRLTSLRNKGPGLLIDYNECPMIIQGFDGGYAFREIKNMPGMFVEEAIKNEYSHIHDAIQYPATRLFMFDNSRITKADGVTYYDDDEEDYDEFVNLTGRSPITGY
jgi:hypothetical protein